MTNTTTYALPTAAELREFLKYDPDTGSSIIPNPLSAYIERCGVSL